MTVNKDKLVGVIFVLITSIAFTLSNTFVKLTSHQIDTFHITFWRAVIGFFLLSFIMLSKRGKIRSSIRKIDKTAVLWLTIRGVVGAGAVLIYVVAISYVDLGVAGALTNISPVFTIIIARIILKEKLNFKIWFILLLAIAGVFIVKNPFGESFSILHSLIIVVALLIAFLNVSVRKLKLLGIESWIIVFVFFACQFLITLPKVIIDGFNYNLLPFIYMVISGIVEFVGQYTIAKASEYIQARTISILMLLVVFEFMLSSYIVFNEPITPTKLVGASLIVISSAFAVILSVKKSDTTSNGKKF